jgi:hypothetical protein
MANKADPTIHIECPCCHAKLNVDREIGVVLSHEAPVRPPSIDFDDTARMLREQADRVEEKFRLSVEAEKSKEDVLARKFAEGLKKAKDQPIEKPLRDFDLD